MNLEKKYNLTLYSINVHLRCAQQRGTARIALTVEQATV